MLHNDQDSAYFGLIKFPNDPRGKMGVPLSTVVDNVKSLVDQGGLLVSVGVSELIMQYKCLKNYFQVLSEWYGPRWQSKQNPFLHAAGFVGALGFYKETVIPYCHLVKKFSTQHIAAAMDLDPASVITREELKGKQGRASWNEVISLLKARWIAGSQSHQEIEL